MQSSNVTTLSLAHLSLLCCDCETLVRHATAAGFDAVDLRLSPATATDRSYTVAERELVCRQLLPLLRDTGMRVWDVEIIRIDARTRAQDHLPLLEVAARLGARRLKVVADSPDESLVAGRPVRPGGSARRAPAGDATSPSGEPGSTIAKRARPAGPCARPVACHTCIASHTTRMTPP